MKPGKKDFLYMQIYNDLRRKIDRKILQEGQKLGTEQELQKEYQVSRDTIRKALFKLEQDGCIERRTAVGTFVRKPKSDYKLGRMKSFTEQMKERGLTPSSDILSIELLREIPKEAAIELNQVGKRKVYRITRIRYADEVPMAYSIDYIPFYLCPDIQQHLHANASLYQIFERSYNLHLSYGKVLLEAEMPSPYLQNVLNISKNKPVLKMRCTGYLENDIPLYYVECYYVGDQYVFSTITDR